MTSVENDDVSKLKEELKYFGKNGVPAIIGSELTGIVCINGQYFYERFDRKWPVVDLNEAVEGWRRWLTST